MFLSPQSCHINDRKLILTAFSSRFEFYKNKYKVKTIFSVLFRLKMLSTEISEQFPCCYLLPYVQRSFSDVKIFVKTPCFQVSSVKNNFGKSYNRIGNLLQEECGTIPGISFLVFNYHIYFLKDGYSC